MSYADELNYVAWKYQFAMPAVYWQQLLGVSRQAAEALEKEGKKRMAAEPKRVGESLDDYLDRRTVEEYGLEELDQAIERYADQPEGEQVALAGAAVAEGVHPDDLELADTIVTDEQGKVGLVVGVPAETGRRYWNIRDVVGGVAEKAWDLVNWALWRHNQALKTIEQAQLKADLQRLQIQHWQEHEQRAAKRTVQYFEGVLYQARLDFYPGNETVTFPNGKLCMTKQRAKIRWDEDAALVWAAGRPDVDDLAPRKLSRSATKAVLVKMKTGGMYVLADTGEVVTFVEDVAPDPPYEFEIKQ